MRHHEEYIIVTLSIVAKATFERDHMPLYIAKITVGNMYIRAIVINHTTIHLQSDTARGNLVTEETVSDLMINYCLPILTSGVILSTFKTVQVYSLDSPDSPDSRQIIDGAYS